MNKSKYSLFIILIMILSISAVSAAEITDASDDVITSITDDSTVLEAETVDDVAVQATSDNDVIADPGDSKNFTTLQNEISSGFFQLGSDYVRAEGENEIEITSSVVIVGNDEYKIDANNLGGIFKVTADATLTLNNVVLVNGNANQGGAIYNEGKLNVISSQISNSNASTGGAIYNTGIASISGSTLDGNTATNYGGSVYSEGTVIVDSSKFENNKITAASAYNPDTYCNGGAAIFTNAGSTLTVKGSTFNGNTAPRDKFGYFTAGGAIYVYGAAVDIATSQFNDNVAGLGGAVIFENYDENGVTITDCDFTGNNAWQGGAVNVNNGVGDLTITKSNFYDNTATQPGLGGSSASNPAASTGGAITIGTMSSDSAKIDISESLFESNSATHGGAICISASNTATISGSEFTDNTADIGSAIVVNGNGATIDDSSFTDNNGGLGTVYFNAGTDNTLSNSLFEGNTAMGGWDIANVGKLSLTNNTINKESAGIISYSGGVITSELTVTILNNDTITLASDDIIINATVADDDVNIIYDQSNNIKFIINDEEISANYNAAIKLYQASYTLPGPGLYTITATNAGNPLNVKTGAIKNTKGSYTDLQEKINNADGTLELEYNFTYNEDIDGTNFPNGVLISTPITINGNGYTIGGNNSYRIFNVTADATLNNITFVNGVADYGGAVYVSKGSTVNVNNSIFTDNVATYRGGAIYSEGTVNVDNSVFEDNDNTYRAKNVDNGGSAIYNLDGSLKVNNSQFNNNLKNLVLRGADGKTGDLINGIITSSGATEIYNSNFTNNSGCYGAAVCVLPVTSNSHSSLIVDNSNFINNTAYTGAAIYVGWGAVDYTITNSLFENNTAKGIGSVGYTSAAGAILIISNPTPGTVTGCEFNNNNAPEGGAISIEKAKVTIDECNFTDNKATTGGAISILNAGEVSVSNSNFTDNEATYGNAIYNEKTNLKLSNNIINTENADIYNNNGEIITKVNIVVLNNQTVVTTDYNVKLNATVTDDNGNIILDNTNIYFVINDEEILAVYNTTSNIYEVSYTLPDLGLYPVTVKNDKFTDLTIKTGAFNNIKGTYTDLQNRIDNAENEVLDLPYNFTYSDKVDGENFPNGVLIATPITINGNGYTISGNNSHRIFNVTADATIKNTTFVNGSASEFGGAIYASADLTVTDSVFDSNNIVSQATDGEFGGSAIFADKGTTLTVKASNFTNNNKDYVDGEQSYGAVAVANIAIVEDSYFTNNYARWGGSITTVGYLDVDNDAVLTIKDTIFENNKADYAGAVFTQDSSLIIDGSKFNANEAYTDGGAIVHDALGNANHNVVITNSVFDSNKAARYGSAIDAISSFTYSGLNFTNNQAPSGTAAIHYMGTLGDGAYDDSSIIDCRFEDNSAAYYGAIYFYGLKSLDIIDSQFISNTANIRSGAVFFAGNDLTIESTNFTENKANGSPAYAGAVYYDTNTGNGALTIDDSKFTGNTAKWSGAIFVNTGAASISNSEFVDNVAENYGGAVFFGGSDLTIDDSKFTGNTAEYSGAVFVNRGTASISNSEFADNVGSTYINSIMSATKLALENNTINTEKAEIFTYSANGIITSQVNITVLENKTVDLNDKVLITAKVTDDNGNLIKDTKFILVVNETPITTSFNATSGLYQGTFTPATVGVYIASMTYTTTENLNIKTATLRSIKGTYTDLQNQIDAAGDTLVLPYDFIYTPEIDGDSFVNGVLISNPITIDGNGSVISGNNSHRIFNIAADATITNMTLTNGSVNSISPMIITGGAINIGRDVDVTIDSVNFTNNYARGSGAAIYTLSKVTIKDSNFTDNVAGMNGGAIHIYSGEGSIISNSNFIGNNATSNRGGAIYAQKGIIVKDSTFENNFANTDAGAICFLSGSSNSVIENSEFITNKANKQAGAVWAADSLTISGSNFTDNACDNVISVLSSNDVKPVIIKDSNIKSDMETIIKNMGTLTLERNNISGNVLNVLAKTNSLSLSENNIAGIIDNTGNIITEINVVILNNETVTFNGKQFITAKITDDNDNIIKDERFKLVVNGTEVETTYNETSKLYQGTYTNNTGGIYIANISYITTENLIIKTATLRNIKGTYTDLQEQINNASDELVLPYDFKYTPEIDGNGFNAGVKITKDISIDGNGSTINGNNTKGIFDISNAVVTIKNVTLTNGSYLFGGAMYIGRNADVTVENVNFTNNKARGSGAAIYTLSKVTIKDSNFTDNVAGMNAGAIHIQNGEGSSISNSNFIGNNATGTDSTGRGGAIYANKGITVIESTFENNFANTDAGAIFFYSGSSNSVIENSKFIANKANKQAGAVWIADTLTISGSNFTDNAGNNVIYIPASISAKPVIIKDSIINGASENVIINRNVLTLERNNITGNVLNSQVNANISLSKNNIDGIINNTGNILTEVNAVILNNETISADLGSVVTLNATLTDDNNNNIYDSRFKFTVNDEEINATYDEENALYTAQYTIANAGEIVVTTSYNANISIGIINVEKANATLNITVEDINVGEKAIVNINLTGVNNTGLNATFTVVVNNTEYTVTTVDGIASFEVENLTAGNYDAFAVYEGDSNYNHNYASDLFTVNKLQDKITITVTPAGGDYGTTIEITAVAESGLEVNITVNGEEYTAPITPGAGEYTVVATTKGNDTYEAASNTTNFTISKAENTLTIANVTAPAIGEDLTLNITLGKVNGTVNVVVDGEKYTATLTNGNGTYTIEGVTAGDHSVVVIYPGDDNNTFAYETYKFSVDKLDSPITITVNDTYKVTDTISIVISDPNANVTVNGAEFDETQTAYAAGTYTITATVEENATNKANSTTKTFTVVKLDSPITITAEKSYNVNDTVNIAVDAPAGAVITVNGEAFDADKHAYAAGTYTIVVTVEENATNKANSTTKTFTVNKLASEVTIGEIATQTVNNEFTFTVENNTAVKVTINGTEYAVVNGNVTVSGLAAGTYTVVAVIDENDNYTASSDSKTFTVEKKDSLINPVTVEPVTVGQKSTINVGLNSTESGSVIIEIDGVNYTANINGGIATLEIAVDANTTAKAYYLGDDEFNAATPVEFTINVNDKADSIIVIDDADLTIGQSATITATVNGAAADIVYTINGAEGATIANVEAGTYTVTATFAGNATNKANSTTRTFTVTKADSPITITANDTYTVLDDIVIGIDAPAGAVITVNGEAFDADKTAYAAGTYTIVVTVEENATNKANTSSKTFTVTKVDSPISITVNDTYTVLDAISIVVSDPNAIITVNGEAFDADKHAYAAGTYTVTATVAENATNKANSTTKTFTVSKVTPDVKVSADPINVGDDASINIEVEDATGIVLVDVDGAKYYESLDAGKATVTVKGLTENTTVTVTYLGDEKYTENTNTSDITVNKVSDITMNTTPSENNKVGEDATINVELPSDATGDVTAYIDGTPVANAAVENGKATITLSDLPEGDSTVEVKYSGDEKYEPTANTTTVSVSKTDITPEVTADEKPVGEDSAVTVTVPEDATGNVTVTVDGVPYEVPIENGTATLPLSNLTAGEHNITVSYPGDDKYSPIDENNTINIPQGEVTPEVTIPENITAGEPAEITVTVPSDATGNVTVTVDGVPYEAPIENGTAKVPIDGLTAGDHEVEVTYSGDDNYKPATTQEKITADAKDADANVTVPEEAKVGDTPAAEVQLPEDATGNVTVIVDGREVANVPVENGTANIPLDNLTAGDHIVEVKYSGDDKYSPASETKEISVSKVTPTVNATAGEITEGETATITVEVPSDATGVVLVEIDGNKYYGDIENGKATVNAPGLKANDYTANVSYPGDEKYGNATTTVDIKVKAVEPTPEPADSNMTADVPAETTTDKTPVATVTLPEDATGNVSVLVDGKEVATVPVENGTASIPLDNLTPGAHLIETKYSGDDKYAPASSANAILVSEPETPEPVNPNMNTTVPGESTVGETPAVDVTLPEDATGNVSVLVDGKEVANVPVTNGTASVPLKDLTPGAHLIETKYSGDDKYAPESGANAILVSEPVTPEPANPNMNTTVPSEANPGDKVSADTKLPTDATGNVSVLVDGKEVANVPVTNGTASVPLDNLTPGAHVIETKYSGDDKYAPASVSNVIVINEQVKVKVDTILLANQTLTRVANDFYKTGEKGGDYYVELFDTNGNPLANKTIQVAINGVQYNITTESDGKAHQQINMESGNVYTYAFAFQGDDDYNAAPLNSTRLTVTKKTTSITAKAKTFKASAKTKSITVTLKTSKNPYDGKTYLSSGKKLTLKVNGKTYKGKTNAKNQVTFKIKLTKKGKYTAKIKFAGTKIYAASSKSIKVTIK